MQNKKQNSQTTQTIFSGNKVLLTGSNGFVGKALKNKLHENNYEVFDYDLPECDILNKNKLHEKIKNVDYVIHAAAIADLYETEKNIELNFDVNVKGTLHVANVCSFYNKPLIFISTCCVYGDTQHESDTEILTIPATREPYACSKVAGEYVIRGTKNLNYIILRIGTVYGPEMRETLFNFIAFDRIINKKTITLYGDGTQTRQYIYIDDLTNGILNSIQRFNYANGMILNLCGTEQTSNIKVLKTVTKITGMNAQVVINNDERYADIQEEHISNDLAQVVLEWRPKTKYIDGMIATYNNDSRITEWRKALKI